MIGGILTAGRRALWPLAAACAFAFSAAMSFADEARVLCPECGREPPSGAAFCPSCGAAISAAFTRPDDGSVSGQKGPGVEEAPAAAPQVSIARSAAARDVAEARRRRDAGDLASAIVLYRNAQALMAADAGDQQLEKAGRTIAAEAAAVEESFNRSTRLSGRTEALNAAARASESYFRGEGRIPMGRAWVPADWPTSLTPPAIAAVRLSLPIPCADCAGIGTVHCRTCGGRGAVQCKAQGCKNGWIIGKPAHTLYKTPDATVREKCPACNGTAHVTCRDCAGRGSIQCKKCAGSGYAPLCKGCHGSGLETCRDCARKGVREDCPICRGTGKTLCGKCGGDGRSQR